MARLCCVYWKHKCEFSGFKRAQVDVSSFGATKDSFLYWLSLGQRVALIMTLFKKETGKDKYIVFTGGGEGREYCLTLHLSEDGELSICLADRHFGLFYLVEL